MHLLKMIIAGLCLSTAAAAFGQGGYPSSSPVPAFDPNPYIQAVADAHKYYITSGTAGGTLAERTNARNKVIRGRFAEIGEIRAPLYAAFQTREQAHIRCKNSRSGRTKRCPSSINWGPGYSVIPESIGSTRRHFKAGPTLVNAHQIDATLGKAGKGTNHGDYWGTAKLTPEEAAKRVEAEKQQLRNALIARELPTDQALDMEVG
ncbi:hypothetical protein [Sphingobium sp.]|uniref:hypothetical protein n=1 Tax=Sphingobium sp. TaxID=1912891 RepID=UPI0028BD45AA|nr:hypothetical protein [Sphingobium sp.]